MQKIYYISLLILFKIPLMHAISTADLFTQANATYRAKNYQGALDTYALIDKKSSAVWYNMANAAYYLGNYVDARLYWKRAYKNASKKMLDGLIRNNALLDKSLGYESKESDNDADLFHQVDYYSRTIPLSLLQIIILMMSCLFCYGIYNKTSNVILFILFTFMLLGNGFVYVRYLMNKTKFGVTQEDQPVYVGPNLLYAHKATIRKALTVYIVDEKNGWYKIKKSSLAGWVPLDKLSSV